ncbi:MAG: type II toxin-antitoxin system RelE/ParE family toxin [Inquilinaceae bacterium]
MRWTRPGLRDLAEVRDRIASDSPSTARRVGQDILTIVQRLGQHPNLRPGRVVGTRELVAPRLPYIVAYRITSETVDIVAVRHGARLWPDALP